MSGRSAHRSPRRLSSVATALVLAGGAAVPAGVLAPAASAHSVLVSVDPRDGAALETPPDQVALTFNEEINQMFASVAVTTGGDGANLVVGEPVVEGPTVTAELDDLAAGDYTVGYRVTSADGHVVSGSSAFSVEPSGSGADGADGADAVGAADTAQADDPAAEPTSDESSSGVDPALWVLGGLAVLLIGGAFLLLRRGR